MRQATKATNSPTARKPTAVNAITKIKWLLVKAFVAVGFSESIFPAFTSMSSLMNLSVLRIMAGALECQEKDFY